MVHDKSNKGKGRSLGDHLEALQDSKFDQELQSNNDVIQIIGLINNELHEIDKALTECPPLPDETGSTYSSLWNNFILHLSKYNEKLKEILIAKDHKCLVEYGDAKFCKQKFIDRATKINNTYTKLYQFAKDHHLHLAQNENDLRADPYYRYNMNKFLTSKIGLDDTIKLIEKELSNPSYPAKARNANIQAKFREKLKGQTDITPVVNLLRSEFDDYSKSMAKYYDAQNNRNNKRLDDKDLDKYDNFIKALELAIVQVSNILKNKHSEVGLIRLKKQDIVAQRLSFIEFIYDKILVTVEQDVAKVFHNSPAAVSSWTNIQRKIIAMDMEKEKVHNRLLVSVYHNEQKKRGRINYKKLDDHEFKR